MIYKNLVTSIKRIMHWEWAEGCCCPYCHVIDDLLEPYFNGVFKIDWFGIIVENQNDILFIKTLLQAFSNLEFTDIRDKNNNLLLGVNFIFRKALEDLNSTDHEIYCDSKQIIESYIDFVDNMCDKDEDYVDFLQAQYDYWIVNLSTEEWLFSAFESSLNTAKKYLNKKEL